MKVKDCFYLRLLPTTKSERIVAMCGNLGLTAAKVEVPHAVLKLNNVAARKSVEDKLNGSKLFSQVTFVKNFNIEA